MLNILSKSNVQNHILQLTRQKVIKEGRTNNNIFSLIFSSVSINFCDKYKTFLQELLSSLVEQFISPMNDSNISIDEGIRCLDILEQNKNLYFSKREEILEKAKKCCLSGYR